MSFKSTLQKIGLIAEDDVIQPVESKLGIMTSATKKSLQSFFSTKTVSLSATVGFNGTKFYVATFDGTVVKEFETYEDATAFVSVNQPNDNPADVAAVIKASEADTIQSQIDALTAQKAAIQTKE